MILHYLWMERVKEILEVERSPEFGGFGFADFVDFVDLTQNVG